MRSRSRGAPPPAPSRSARAGSSPAARIPCRTRDAWSSDLEGKAHACDANAVTIADLRPTDEILELRARVRAFMEAHVYPNEPALSQEDEEADALVERLRGLAKEQGLWAPHLPPEAGGTSGSFLTYAYLNEEIGRSVWGQLILGCQAPDAGNAEILWQFGTEEQKERWLRPLVAGEVRSFFSMTEPEAPGSDPTTLRTRAVR